MNNFLGSFIEHVIMRENKMDKEHWRLMLTSGTLSRHMILIQAGVHYEY